VQYFYSVDGNNFIEIEKLIDAKPLPESGKGEVQYFTSNFSPIKARYIKIIGKNIKKAPAWHSGVGLPVWIFADEVEVR
jgi:hexosaminidase